MQPQPGVLQLRGEAKVRACCRSGLPRVQLLPFPTTASSPQQDAKRHGALCAHPLEHKRPEQSLVGTRLGLGGLGRPFAGHVFLAEGAEVWTRPWRCRTWAGCGRGAPGARTARPSTTGSRWQNRAFHECLGIPEQRGFALRAVEAD